MNDGININKGFEAMLPKPKRKLPKEDYFRNLISFKFLKKRFKLSVEVSEEKDD